MAREGGRVKNVISLTLWGGRGESGASPPWLTLLLLLQLERDFKVLMPVERRNTARRLQARRDEVVTDGRLKELRELREARGGEGGGGGGGWERDGVFSLFKAPERNPFAKCHFPLLLPW